MPALLGCRSAALHRSGASFYLKGGTEGTTGTSTHSAGPIINAGNIREFISEVIKEVGTRLNC
ncbi:MAG: hypothetical protein EXR74_02420 [Bdellovibrionales bacterium]|nr:hypothetical protein [Bdellovibrionales bacterium]